MADSPDQLLANFYAHARKRAIERYGFDLHHAEWVIMSNHVAVSGEEIPQTGPTEEGRVRYRITWRGRVVIVVFDIYAKAIVTLLDPPTFADDYAKRTGHELFAGAADPKPGSDQFPGPGPRPPGRTPPPRPIPEGVRDPSGPQEEPEPVRPAPPPPPPPGGRSAIEERILNDGIDSDLEAERSGYGVGLEPELLPPDTDKLSPYHDGPVDIDGEFGYADSGSSAINADGNTQRGGTQTMQQAPAFQFKRAEKRQGKLRLAFMGPSGSGKTLSALLLASGIGKKIALIDTENFSAADYADRIDFDLAVITPPYTVQKYLSAIEAAELGGYDVIIVDSLTHAWAGDGGLLEQKDIMDAAGGNAFKNWAKISPLHGRLVSKILQNKQHLIVTVRSKTKYAMEEKTGGGTRVAKLGIDPVFRDGIEYEFTVAFDMLMSHHAQASKDRTSLFDQQSFIPTAETGKKLLAWRMEGADPAHSEVAIVQAPDAAEPATAAPAPGNGAPATAAAPDRPSESDYDTLRTIGQGMDPKKSIGTLAREAGFKMPITGTQAQQIILKYTGAPATE